LRRAHSHRIPRQRLRAKFAKSAKDARKKSFLVFLGDLGALGELGANQPGASRLVCSAFNSAFVFAAAIIFAGFAPGRYDPRSCAAPARRRCGVIS
jgi:hypothetical protein